MPRYRDPLPDDREFEEPMVVGYLPDDIAAHYRQRDVTYGWPRYHNESMHDISAVLLALILRELTARDV